MLTFKEAVQTFKAYNLDVADCVIDTHMEECNRISAETQRDSRTLLESLCHNWTSRAVSGRAW